jgi:ATP-dependent Lon protease
MVMTRNEKTAIAAAKKRAELKKKKAKEPESSDDEESLGSEDTDEDEYETVSEDEDEDEDEEPVKKTKKYTREEFQQLLAATYPSKYMDKKTKKNKKVYDADEDDDDDEYLPEEDDDDEDDGKKINIVFGFGGGGYDDEEEDDEPVEDENEECNSDDEEVFAKETYQAETEKKAKKTKIVEEAQALIDFDSEYADLVELRNLFAEKLKKKPTSKTLSRSLQDCRDEIKELVRKARHQNVKEYHALANAHKQKMVNEMDYFKTKLSHKEQIKMMRDLKAINDHVQINKPYIVSLLESDIPTKYKATVMQKLNSLKTMDTCDPEYHKTKSWIDTFMRIPFGKYKSLDVKMSDGVEVCQKFMTDAMKTLDECTFGLTDAKMQIMQMIGQWIANPSAMGTAIAIHGAPGTGKTTLVKDGISKILGRDFVFIPLGGAGDGSYLVGHSSTYVDSVHGKIVQSLIDCKSMNPVFFFDEVDKLSDKNNEIESILTHLTDTTQNDEFNDKFFPDVKFDLNKALFIFSYNEEANVNPILRDRMYRIKTKGYTTKEKITIANNYIIPKIRDQVNFKKEDITIPDETLEYIITNEKLTKTEEGVRNLKRCLEIIYTKLNLFRLVSSEKTLFSKDIDIKVRFPMTVSKKDVDALINKGDENQSQSVLNSMYL